MTKLVFNILILFAFCQIVTAQTYVYEAVSDGHRLGTITAVREINDEAEKISISIRIDSVGTNGHSYLAQSNASYMDGYLVDVVSMIKTDGLITSTQTTLKNGSYLTITNGITRLIDKEVLYGTDLLYFEKPSGFESMYLPSIVDFVSLKAISEGSWQTLQGDVTVTYAYRNNQLVSLIWRHADYELIFRLKKQL